MRYPGGKARVMRFIGKIMEKNALLGGTYVEPYAGGAGVAWGLLLKEYARRIVLNDISRPVYAIWHSILNHTDDFCERVERVPLSPAQWRKQRKVLMDPGAELFDLGVAAFYLNRTNRSGIIVQGGMIGGNDQEGEWKLDARFNRAGLVDRIQRLGEYRGRVTLYNMDASKLLKTKVPELGPRTLIYLDPPYYVKGSQNLYDDFYDHESHEAIADQVAQLQQPWVVSYDNAIEIRRMYTGFRKRVYALGYSARDRYDGDEIMFFSAGLKIPHGDPSLASA
jgi:DNA adenine methylase